jgi:large-conductance mechanosensitive channel
MSFREFLVEKKILDMGISFMISYQLRMIISKVISNIIIPIIEQNIYKDIQKFKIKVFNTELQIGDILSNILSFIIVLYIIYWVYTIEKKINNN